MDFHDCYKKNTPFWRVFTAEFEMTQDFSVLCPVKGFKMDLGVGSINKDGLLTVRTGFKWGASGLTADGPSWCGKSSRRASCFHDLLYLLANNGCFANSEDSEYIRELADMFFYSMLLEDEMWKWRAQKWYYFVDKYGSKYWNKST